MQLQLHHLEIQLAELYWVPIGPRPVNGTFALSPPSIYMRDAVYIKYKFFYSLCM
ncbi:hypothetical protein ISN45_At04g019320 [Arabidopsis thaliana x Arabidopsis arenosa]|uniref:Uncharacterized protein n=2 Tax=Arabidopsis TaxID=3701 RepID=A0A8T2ECF5_ARASU|nr:hypothetical protein ISN45_At04g019320 [Arabidopsis thaliana x Arabidopsis arenosa]KAG7620936.1 hypothetical protein ISN44_As04g018870 [Arabidopsis suecica]